MQGFWGIFPHNDAQSYIYIREGTRATCARHGHIWQILAAWGHIARICFFCLKCPPARPPHACLYALFLSPWQASPAWAIKTRIKTSKPPRADKHFGQKKQRAQRAPIRPRPPYMPMPTRKRLAPLRVYIYMIERRARKYSPKTLHIPEKIPTFAPKFSKSL